MVRLKFSGNNNGSSLLKKKLRLTIYIRIILGLLLPVSFYAVSNLTSGSSQELVTHNNSPDVLSSRKLLSINESETVENITRHSVKCNAPAINEFPSDGFTREQRQNGIIALHIALACYCFWFLAIICDEYFVPTIEGLCDSLQMEEDVAGATLMAMATSSPEMFINCIGTFITKGDLGVGSTIGAAVFNVLAVPACCGIFAKEVVKLHWWPISRDCSMYTIAVIGLILVLMDGKVMWYEALSLVLCYFIYLIVLYYNDVISKKAKSVVTKYRIKYKPRPYQEVSEISPLLSHEKKHYMNGTCQPPEVIINGFSKLKDEEESLEVASSPWERVDENLFIYILKWPLTFLLWLTIPDCRKHPSYRALTFICCLVYIALTSYTVSFLITIFGDTLNIPDSVTGLTFLAAGTSVPEAVSSVIVTNQGHGAMGISNSIGSNTFDILLCLGIPWLIKALLMPAVPDHPWVSINSTGLTYSAIILLSSLFGLYLVLLFNKFELNRKIGITFAVMYLLLLLLASLVEMNVFFIVNIPTCGR